MKENYRLYAFKQELLRLSARRVPPRATRVRRRQRRHRWPMLQFFVDERMVFAQVMFRDFSVPERPVDRVHIRIEDDEIEVPDEDGTDCEDRFVKVQRGGDVEPPS